MNSPPSPSPSPLDRLKVLINSSTPIVVMETVEEVRALMLVRAACSDLNMAVFEWTIADGLVRSGSERPRGAACGGAVGVPNANPARQQRSRSVGASRAVVGRVRCWRRSEDQAMYNTTDPVQALANLETMTIEAVFVLKDFHRHMDNPVVVRRLRDVGQKFSANRRTLVLTAPAIEMPPEAGQPGRVSRSAAARSRPAARNHPRNLYAHGRHAHAEAAARRQWRGRDGRQSPRPDRRGSRARHLADGGRTPGAFARLRHRRARRQESSAEALGNAGVRRRDRQHVERRRPG